MIKNIFFVLTCTLSTRYLLFREKGFFTKLKETVLGKESPWSGRFDLMSDKIVIKLDTGEDNSLFYAVTLAKHPGLSPDEVKEKASFMRAEVGD